MRATQPTNFDVVSAVLGRVYESQADRDLEARLFSANIENDRSKASAVLRDWLAKRGLKVLVSPNAGAPWSGWANIDLGGNWSAAVHAKINRIGEDGLITLSAYATNSASDDSYVIGEDTRYHGLRKTVWMPPSVAVEKLREFQQEIADQMSALSDEIKGELGEAKKPRDDISKLPMPASGRRYARLHGLKDMVPERKLGLYMKMAADLVNRGKTKGFASRDAAGKVKKTF